MHVRNMTPLGASPLAPTLCSHSRAATSVVRGSGCGASAPPDFIGNESRISSSGVHVNNPSDRDLQRAEGCGRIVMSSWKNETRIVDILERSPIRIMLPVVDGGALKEAVLVNTAGGIAGGDRLEFSVTALAGASIAVSSQAAERVYRALNEPAFIETQLKACAGAKLAWLPQETIIFNLARLSRETEIDLTSGAELLALEWLVLGRAAHGEEMAGGHINDTWRVRKDGRLVWADTFRITNEIFSHLHRKALLGDCKAVGTLIYFGPDLDKWKDFIRESTASSDCYGAVSSVGGLIIVRFAAKGSFALRRVVRSVLQKFGQELAPGPFRVPKMWSC